MDLNDIGTEFEKYFRLILADTDELRETVYRLRYAVYAEDLHFEEENREKLEKDAFDPFSQHCLLKHLSTNTYAGTIRLVRSNPQCESGRFPFEAHCTGKLETNSIDMTTLDREYYGEISRLAVLSGFRRRKGEHLSPDGLVSKPTMYSENERRTFPYIALGLSLAAAAMGLQAGLKGVFVMMEPRLARLLEHYGIRFQSIGEIIKYHGKRRGPYFISEQDLRNHLPQTTWALLDMIQGDIRAANG